MACIVVAYTHLQAAFDVLALLAAHSISSASSQHDSAHINGVIGHIVIVIIATARFNLCVCMQGQG